jgi:hypothetical protein
MYKIYRELRNSIAVREIDQRKYEGTVTYKTVTYKTVTHNGPDVKQ